MLPIILTLHYISKWIIDQESKYVDLSIVEELDPTGKD